MAAFAVFLVTGFPLRILFPVALIVATYLKPQCAGDRIQQVPFWIGLAGCIGLAGLSLPGAANPLLAAITTLVVIAGGLLTILAQAAAGHARAGAIDLALLFLVCLIGYPFFAATLE